MLKATFTATISDVQGNVVATLSDAKDFSDEKEVRKANDKVIKMLDSINKDLTRFGKKNHTGPFFRAEASFKSVDENGTLVLGYEAHVGPFLDAKDLEQLNRIHEQLK